MGWVDNRICHEENQDINVDDCPIMLSLTLNNRTVYLWGGSRRNPEFSVLGLAKYDTLSIKQSQLCDLDFMKSWAEEKLREEISSDVPGIDIGSFEYIKYPVKKTSIKELEEWFK